MKKISLFLLFVVLLFAPCFAKGKQPENSVWVDISRLTSGQKTDFPAVMVIEGKKKRFFALVHFFPKVEGGAIYFVKTDDGVYPVKKVKNIGNEIAEVIIGKKPEDTAKLIKGFAVTPVSGIMGREVTGRNYEKTEVLGLVDSRMSNIRCFSSFAVSDKKGKKIHGLLCDGSALKDAKAYVGAPFVSISRGEVYLMSFIGSKPYNRGADKIFPVVFMNKVEY